MTLAAEYRQSQRSEEIARLRRVLALRAMGAVGMTQREIAQELGVSQSAVSQQLRSAPNLALVHPESLIEAAGPVLAAVAAARGYSRMGVFGSVARGEARHDSDIDLIVEPVSGASSFDFMKFKQVIEGVLGRKVDLISYGGLKPGTDEDIRQDLVLL
ncbi:MAG: nucleotidyltransferase domain-containing protein [Brooklawnia sp.]|jgi:predicted nucleotidyltransferase